MAESQRAGTEYPRRDTETDRTATVDVDVRENTLRVEATIVKTKTCELDELFTETPDDPRAEARLKTSKDPGFGWSGFEIRDGELYRVNYQKTDDGGRYLEESRTSPEKVLETIREIVEDDDVGFGYGDFAARRPGAGF